MKLAIEHGIENFHYHNGPINPSKGITNYDVISQFIFGARISIRDIVSIDNAIAGNEQYFFPIYFRYFANYDFHNATTSPEVVASQFYWIKDSKIFNDLKSGKCLLVILDFWEAFYFLDITNGRRYSSFSYQKMMDSLLEYLDINPKHILFVDGDNNNNTHDSKIRFASDVGFFEWFSVRMIQDLKKPSEHFMEMHHPLVIKPKRFLSYSRHWNAYRQLLTFEFFHRKLDKFGLISLSKSYDEKHTHDDQILKYELSLWDKEIISKQNINEEISNFISKLPLVLDYTLQDNLAHSLNQQHYYDTDISIVNETHESADVLFLTEKIWKTIFAKHPFIIMGNPGSLALLRSLGYKTFEPYVDETYDSIKNLTNRKNLILKEIQKICEMTDSDRLVWYENVNQITEHNYQHFLKRISNFCFENTIAAIKQALLENYKGIK